MSSTSRFPQPSNARRRDSAGICVPSSWRERLIVIAGFTMLTAVMTYPQIFVMSTHLGPHYDTLFSVWRLAWIAHQLTTDPLHLLDANIFYPTARTLTYSDALLLPALTGAPLIWLGLSPVTVHNVLLLFSFVACGAGMYFLVRWLTNSIPAAWIAGAIFAFQPYRFGHYPQLELLWAWPMPLAFLAFHKLHDRRRTQDAVWLGVLVAMQIWSCVYYGIFLVTALVILSLVTVPGRPGVGIIGLVKSALIAALVAGVLIAPYAWAYSDTWRVVGARQEDEVRQWSPTIVNYIATPAGSLLYGRITARYGHLEGIMFPGLIAIALGLVALWPPLDRRRLAYAALLLIAVDLSFGFNGLSYPFLYRTVWIYRALRVPARLWTVASAALAVLAGDGVARLLSRIRDDRRAAVFALSVFGLVVSESLCTPLTLTAIAPKAPMVYNWLHRQRRGTVLEWPVPKASNLGDTHDPLYMYYSTFHWQPMINGYSGFFPQSYLLLLDTMRAFPARSVLNTLRQRRVKYVLLHSAFDPGYTVAVEALRAAPEFELMFIVREHPGELALFRVREGF